MSDLSKNEDRSLSRALEMVHEAASEVWLDVGEEHLLDGIDTFGDFVGNHHDKIDALYGDRFPLDGQARENAVSEFLEDVSGVTDHDLDRAARATIEVAARRAIDVPDADLSRALDVTASFWSDAGADICAETVSLNTDEAEGPDVP